MNVPDELAMGSIVKVTPVLSPIRCVMSRIRATYSIDNRYSSSAPGKQLPECVNTLSILD